MKYIQNSPDIKDSAGLWVRSWNDKAANLCYRTRSDVLWRAVVARCLPGGSFQSNHNTYVGVTNGFTDFQQFAEWCQDQYGYMFKESSGHYWHLDKDMIIRDNKVYSPETYLFIPSRINNLFIAFSKKSRNNLYPGVSFDKTGSRFMVNIRLLNGKDHRQVYLGTYRTLQEAINVYVKSKVDHIKDLCLNDPEIASHQRLVECLECKIELLEKHCV